MADHQVIGLLKLAEQVLPRCLDKGGVLSSGGKTLAGAIQHRLGGFRQRHLMATLGQPKRHMAEARADIQHPQWAFGQHFGQVSLEYGQANRALGAAIDLLGKARGQFVEVTITHWMRSRGSAVRCRLAWRAPPVPYPDPARRTAAPSRGSRRRFPGRHGPVVQLAVRGTALRSATGRFPPARPFPRWPPWPGSSGCGMAASRCGHEWRACGWLVRRGSSGAPAKRSIASGVARRAGVPPDAM